MRPLGTVVHKTRAVLASQETLHDHASCHQHTCRTQGVLPASSPEGLLAEALTLARKVAAVRPLPLLRHCSVPAPSRPDYFEQRRAFLQGRSVHMPALLKCVDAVEAATQQPIEQGLHTEIELFLQLLNGPESRALRHLFLLSVQPARLLGCRSGRRCVLSKK